MPDCGILLARPMVGYATAEMFARYDRLSPEGPKTPLTFEAACAALRAQSLCTLAPLIANDLERAAPDGAAAHLKRRLLDAGAAVAAMTGSGSAVFGLFESEREARKALESIRPAPFWAAVTKPVSGGPIQAEIA
jgi:4-diphosphocytidyl-2-C-methyl-D-erythritol kinase